MSLRSASPRVSVLLPVRGERTTTPAAVTSLLSQTFEDFELLVIGQAEAPVSPSPLPRDSRIRQIRRRAPGIVGALNTGIKEARGDFIARMDDDDLAHPERLSTQIQMLGGEHEPLLIGTRVRMIDSSGGTAGVAGGSLRYAAWLNDLIENKAIQQAIFIENPLPHPTWLASRRVFEDLGGYRQGDFPEDHDFILRAARAGVRFAKTDRVLVDWRDHEERLTRTDPRYRQEAFIEMKAEALCHPDAGFDLSPGFTRGVWIAGVGRSARRWCDALLARDVPVRGFVDLAGPKMRNRKRHRPVVDYDGLLSQRGNDLLVGAVTRPEARKSLDTWCIEAGLSPMIDYVLGD